MDPIEDCKDRLLLLLNRRDPSRFLFRVANTSTPADGTRRGVNAVKAGAVNEFPRTTIDAINGACDVYAPADGVAIDQFAGYADPDEDTEFSHAQEYECIIVHEGTNDRKNGRTDRNAFAAWVAGGPKLADPSPPTGTVTESELPFVHSWRCGWRCRKQYDGEIIRGLTIFTVTVNMILRRSEILSIDLPDPAKKGEI